jgi:alpha-tubulin suppressor-like RCC1 family protein
MKRIVVCVLVSMFMVSVHPVRASTTVTEGIASTGRESTRLVVGDNHSCLLLHDGSVKCWGDNTYGQLGVSGITSSKTPVTVSSFGVNRYAVEIAAGKQHSCALLNDASVSCWGDNGFGNLGDGTYVTSMVPVAVSMQGTKALKIAAGGFTTCMLSTSHVVFCWGSNSSGQIVSSTDLMTSVPIDIGIELNVSSLAIGATHVCVLSIDAVCWGGNGAGQLGDGTLLGRNVPEPVSSFGSNNISTKMSTGDLHTCAVINSGEMKCWGSNSSGRLGDGTNTDRMTPTKVSLQQTFIDVATGTSHSCGRISDGTVFCWGSNSGGRLGNNLTQSSSVPVRSQLPQGTTARQIAAGLSHTCALLDSDDVMCWGNNSSGKLGDGTITQRLVPTKVIGLRTAPGSVSSSTANITHNSATVLSSFSSIDVSSHRILEYGTDEFLAGSTQTIDLGHFGSIQHVATGPNHSCVVIAGGHVKCWGDNSDGALGTGDRTSHPQPVDVSELTGYVRLVAVGASHTCAVMSTGSLKCWGDNSAGQLGDGTLLSKTAPTDADISGVVDVALGEDFTCALKAGGEVWCWGTNTLGQLGRVSASSSVPVTVSVDPDHSVVSVASSASRTCAVFSNATVKCWGKGIQGVASPGQFSSSVDGVSVADNHACAVLHNGSIQCWGDDSSGQLGDGDSDSSGQLTTSTLTTGERAIAVNVDSDASCALLVNGAVKCWGDGAVGITAFGTALDVNTPTLVPELISVTQLSLSELHGCALAGQGDLWCWGSNTRQQRGTDGASISVPTQLSSFVHASVSTDLSDLEDDESYFYRIVTTSLGQTTYGAIQTFNTIERPASTPIDDAPIVDPPINVPDIDDPPIASPPPRDTPRSDTPTGQETETIDQRNTQAPSANSSVSNALTGDVKKARPSVKVGSLTRVRVVLRKLDVVLPKATSQTKMWLTVLDKRVCRVYGTQLWAIRTGTCQLMVLKMSPSRRLTMSRTQIRVVR